MYIYVCKYIHIYAYICMCIYMYMYICIYVCVWLFLNASKSTLRVSYKCIREYSHLPVCPGVSTKRSDLAYQSERSVIELSRRSR